MSEIPTPEDLYEQHARRLCVQCGHSFVWHGISVGHPDSPDHVPEGCGVRGCTCNQTDPGDL